MLDIGFFAQAKNKGGCALLVLPFNGVCNPPYPQNIIQAVIINTTPRLLPLKSFDLICEELPILDLMAPRHQGPSQLLLLCHQERNIFQGKQVSKSGFQMVMEWKFRALVRSTALSKCTWLKNTTIGTSVSTES